MIAVETDKTNVKNLCDQRENISILFLGFTREAAASIQASLQAARISPRCRLINKLTDLTGSLSERSWDLLLMSSTSLQDLSFQQASQTLKELNKDIPMLLLCENQPSPDEHLTLLEQDIQVIVNSNSEKLTVLYIYQTLAALKQRKHWRHCENLLEKAQHRVKELIHDANTAICLIKENEIQYANESFLKLFNFEDQSDVLGNSIEKFCTHAAKDGLLTEISELLAGHKSLATLETDLMTADTQRLHVKITLQPCLFDENEVVQLDIKEHLPELENISPSHTYSSLLERSAFTKELELQLEQARSGGHDGYLFYISLTGLAETLNDLEEADQQDVRLTVNQCLLSFSHPTVTLGQIEPTTFTLLLSNPHQDAAKKLADSVSNRFAELGIEVKGIKINTNCSIGISIINESTPRADDLFLRAETACHSIDLTQTQAKGYRFYQKDLKTPVVGNDPKAIKRIIDAITLNQFRLLFQPIIPLETEISIANFEVFLRLSTADGELSPTIFTSSIKDDNVLARMDMWVLEECLMLMRQSADQDKRARLYINVTGRTLKNRSLLPWFASQLRDLNLPANQFVFQISEVDALAAPNYYKAFCHALRKLDCLICLKHFGSTSESKYVLSEQPVDFVKLDASYLKEMNRGNQSISHLTEIVKPIQERGIYVIAPMVEDSNQMRLLFRMGINMVQGHYLQPPQPEMQYDFFNQ